MKLDPDRKYLPADTRGKFYKQRSSIGSVDIYQYHVEKWNPFGNVAIETTTRNPDDTNLIVGRLLGMDSGDNFDFPEEVSTSLVPIEIKKAILVFALDEFKEEFNNMRNL